MASESFEALLELLAKQHAREVAAFDALREENRRLSEELKEIKARDTSDPSVNCETQVAASKDLEDSDRQGSRRFQTLPNLVGKAERQGFSSSEEHPLSVRRRSFPSVIPGMPTEICNTIPRRHHTYLVAPTDEARSPGELEPECKVARLLDGAANQTNQTSHTSPVVPCKQGSDLMSVEPELGLPGMPLDLMCQQAQQDTRRASCAVDSMSLFRRGSSLHLEQTVNDLTERNSKRQLERFRQLMGLVGDVVYEEDLVRVMHKRGNSGFTLEEARRVILELKELDMILTSPDDPVASAQTVDGGSGIDFNKFVQLIATPDLLVRVDPEAIQEVNTVRRLLLVKGADEVISKVTKTRSSPGAINRMASTESVHAQTETMRKLAILNLVVGIVVVMSMITLGASMDVSPAWPGWTVLEVIFGTVFVCEVVLKLGILGWRDYLFGPGWRWNVLDCTITLTTLVDLVLSLVTMGGAAGADISAAKLTLVLRALRLTRIARLVKLLHTPLLSGLANMLAGFMVGVPCMLWVMVLMTVIFYVLGICFRLLVGPPNESFRMEQCGGGGDDFTVDSENLMCQAHLLYGEEYFGTLRVSMFTVFRCVLGDCSSQAGKSLTAAFSSGYGPAFDAVYCGGMVLVVFGLFNIIAAIFVETTISGLKYNNVQRKYARLYESRYVQGKLETLVRRIQELQEAKHPEVESNLGREFVLTEEEFNEVMQDDGVSIILEELDIVLTNRMGLFDMFDCDNNGLVTVAEFVGTLMKVRGEPQKSDMIASWVALRSLNERFQNFERIILENQKRMLEYQRDVWKKELGISSTHGRRASSC